MAKLQNYFVRQTISALFLMIHSLENDDGKKNRDNPNKFSNTEVITNIITFHLRQSSPLSTRTTSKCVEAEFCQSRS